MVRGEGEEGRLWGRRERGKERGEGMGEGVVCSI
jgi:hypothetical protein